MCGCAAGTPLSARQSTAGSTVLANAICTAPSYATGARGGGAGAPGSGPTMQASGTEEGGVGTYPTGMGPQRHPIV
ncbi:hypothetical protein GCM10010425_38880 [Streptomyces spororaveus]|uniref:Uncharacterized protein n=1 Tax=Streptomyces spororaveus TaxID=284039 RepID=A0ABQ3TPU7_9ACTN|nr:hypothetical protein Sspor_79790 [Streptomyces spororaveus]